MSKYTTELRFICEVMGGYDESQGYNKVNDIVTNARSNIFDFEYPIFDESYRATLEVKILKHFYTREIASETVGLWHLWLDTRMNEIMPYYNQLYESALIEFNPMYDIDLTKTGNRKGGKDGATTGLSSDTGKRVSKDVGKTTSQDSGSDSTNIKDTPKNSMWDYFSDTPQGSVTDLASLDYLTNARHVTTDGAGSNRDDVLTYGKKNVTDKTNNNTVDTTNNRTESGTEKVYTAEEYAEKVIGKTGGVSYSKLLQEFRDTFLNIDMMVIRELDDLFFNLW